MHLIRVSQDGVPKHFRKSLRICDLGAESRTLPRPKCGWALWAVGDGRWTQCFYSFCDNSIYLIFTRIVIPDAPNYLISLSVLRSIQPEEPGLICIPTPRLGENIEYWTRNNDCRTGELRLVLSLWLKKRVVFYFPNLPISNSLTN